LAGDLLCHLAWSHLAPIRSTPFSADEPVATNAAHHYQTLKPASGFNPPIFRAAATAVTRSRRAPIYVPIQTHYVNGPLVATAYRRKRAAGVCFKQTGQVSWRGVLQRPLRIHFRRLGPPAIQRAHWRRRIDSTSSALAPGPLTRIESSRPSTAARVDLRKPTKASPPPARDRRPCDPHNHGGKDRWWWVTRRGVGDWVGGGASMMGGKGGGVGTPSGVR